MIKAFLDESADGSGNLVFAMAGVVGREAEWQATESLWLERTGGVPFHAAECEHRGELELYRDLTQILSHSRLAARAVAVDLVAIREHLPGALDDIGYYKCFLLTITWLVDNVAAKLVETIEFTIDSRQTVIHNAAQLYRAGLANTSWPGHAFMATELAVSNRSNPRIQMADLVAREAMKDLHNSLSASPRPRRKSLLALAGGHVSFGVVGREYCVQWRAALDKFEADGLGGERYGRWLDTSGLADNMSNRIKYLTVFFPSSDSESDRP